MRMIKKTRAPRSFQQYIRAENATFEDMDKVVKDDLRESLINEQEGVCAYCQQTLKVEKVKIEHYCEQSICNGEDGMEDKRLDYSNLLAVCLGVGGKPTIQHCDTYKANFDKDSGLPIKVNPQLKPHINTISYSSTGLIRSSNKNYDEEMNKFLNLNTRYLKDLRKRKWSKILRIGTDKKGKLNKNKLRKVIEEELEMTEGKFKFSFPGLSEYMLKKFC